MAEEERDLPSYKTPTGQVPTYTEMKYALRQYEEEMSSDNDIGVKEYLDRFFSTTGVGSELESDDVLDAVSEDLERALTNAERDELSREFDSKLSMKDCSGGVPPLHEVDSPFFEKEEVPVTTQESLDPMDAEGLISSTSESLFRRTLYNFIVKMMYNSARDDVFFRRGTEIGNSIASNFLDRKGPKRDRYYMAAAYFIGSMYNGMPEARSTKDEPRQRIRIVGSSEDVARSFKSMISYAEEKGGQMDIEAYGAEQARRLSEYVPGGLSSKFVRGYRSLLSEIGRAIMRRNPSYAVRAAFESQGFELEENVRSSVPKSRGLESQKDEETEIREIFGGAAVHLLTNTDKGDRLRSRGATLFSLLIPEAKACPPPFRRYLASVDKPTLLGIVEHHLFEGRLSLRSDNHSLCSLAEKRYSLVHDAISGLPMLESHDSMEKVHKSLENRSLCDEEDDAAVDEEAVAIYSSKKKIQIENNGTLSIRVFFVNRLLD